MIDYLKAAFGLSAALIIVGLLFCIAPWLLFWSIETLFGVVIPYTFVNWVAAAALLSLVRGGK